MSGENRRAGASITPPVAIAGERTECPVTQSESRARFDAMPRATLRLAGTHIADVTDRGTAAAVAATVGRTAEGEVALRNDARRRTERVDSGALRPPFTRHVSRGVAALVRKARRIGVAHRAVPQRCVRGVAT